MSLENNSDSLSAGGTDSTATSGSEASEWVARLTDFLSREDEVEAILVQSGAHQVSLAALCWCT